MNVGADGKVSVFTASGIESRCWPVDARERLACGDVFLDKPGQEATPLPVAQVPAPAKAEAVRGSEATREPRGTR